MSQLSNLGYAIFRVSDLQKWKTFAVDIIGFQVARRDDQRVLPLRMDELEQRIVLEQGDGDDLIAAGWELESEEALETYVRELRARGAKVEEGGRELAAQRKVAQLYVLADPNGFQHEFFYGPALAPSSHPFQSTLIPHGFKTGPLGLGHILPAARDYDQSYAFYTNLLGLKLSDHIVTEVAPGHWVRATFFHAASGRHHSLATAAIPNQPRVLNHFMVEVNDMNDVGLAYERCLAANVPVVRTLGHHPNDQMFSFYVQTPSGFAVEIGWNGVVIDDAVWVPTTYPHFSDWGHKHG